MNQLDNVTYMVGDKNIETRPLVPYDDLICEFLNSLSLELRSSRESLAFPDIMTFAFWCRKTNIEKLKADYVDGKLRLGLGLVFHIAPANVPINFAFSFVFGLLAGNANIVRVPSKRFPQVDMVCAAIGRVLDSDMYTQIRAMNALVRYEQDDNITGRFSANCNARIIWGGDETIRRIRKLPTQERCVDIAFSDRYSFCVMDAVSVGRLDKEELVRLAERFYNDTYLMDQNACSSPHLIVWLGQEKETAKEKFWDAIHRTVAKKYNLAAVSVVDKYTLLCQNAVELDNISSFQKYTNYVYRIGLNSLHDGIENLRGMYGFFYEFDMDDINDIAPIVSNRYQTLTYFGINKTDLSNFVIENRLSGIDRIVPVGKALDMDVIWDGFDIVKTLSRVVDLR